MKGNWRSDERKNKCWWRINRKINKAALVVVLQPWCAPSSPHPITINHLITIAHQYTPPYHHIPPHPTTSYHVPPPTTNAYHTQPLHHYSVSHPTTTPHASKPHFDTHYHSSPHPTTVHYFLLPSCTTTHHNTPPSATTCHQTTNKCKPSDWCLQQHAILIILLIMPSPLYNYLVVIHVWEF